MEKIWRLPLNRVYRGMGNWHCRRFPGTKSSKHEFSNRRTLQGTYFLRNNSPAYEFPVDTHSIRALIRPKPTKTFRRNPISGNQVYRKREMCNKTRQPPPPNSDEDILAPLPQTLFTFQPKPSDKNHPRTTRSTENTRSATKRVNLLLKTSDEDARSPYHNPIHRPIKNIR